MNNWLVQLRVSRNLSQQTVAEKVGIDRSYYTKIENGHTPSVKVAKGLGDLLGFDWTFFFTENCANNAQKIIRS